MSQSGLDAYFPVHALRSFAHDRQADSRAAVAFLRINLSEDLKNSSVMDRIDADAVIPEPHAHSAVERLVSNTDSGTIPRFLEAMEVASLALASVLVESIVFEPVPLEGFGQFLELLRSGRFHNIGVGAQRIASV